MSQWRQSNQRNQLPMRYECWRWCARIRDGSAGMFLRVPMANTTRLSAPCLPSDISACGLLLLQVFDCKAGTNTGDKLLFFDLSPLMKTASNWIVDGSKSSSNPAIEINVCQPLVRTASSSSCSLYSGSCDTKANQSLPS